MSRVFIDTNVLVYADQPHAAFHTIARNALIAFEAAGDEQWISLQVIRDYLPVVTRVNPSAVERVPLSPQIAAVAAARFLDTFRIAPDGLDVATRLLDLIAAHSVVGRRVHDVNIVATLLAHDITRLVTFNPRDFQVFGGLIDVIALTPN
jgi:predicted nucleic acid-binding protein